MEFNVVVHDAVTGDPVPEAVVLVNAYLSTDYNVAGRIHPSTRRTGDDGRCNFVARFAGYDPPLLVDVTVVAAGYRPWTTGGDPSRVGKASVEVDARLVPFRRVVRPAPVDRPPLTVPPGPYDAVLPWDPPRVRDYLRADCWGVPIAGLPWVPGASSRHPERGLSWFLDRYPDARQADLLAAHARRGYTHFYLSVPDSLGSTTNWPVPGAGRTLGQFVQTCRLVKSWGFAVGAFLGSKYFQPRDMTPDAWAAYLAPILDAILPVVDEVVPGWEWNAWNVPGDPSLAVFHAVGQRAHAAGATCWLHYTAHVTAWQQDGTDRFAFWRALGGDVDGLLYQTGAATAADGRQLRQPWSIAETQARIVDTLWWFGTAGNRWKFRFFEDLGWLQFDDDEWTEEAANLRGYLACCTVDNVRHTDARVWGYGNGARRPDGSPL